MTTAISSSRPSLPITSPGMHAGYQEQQREILQHTSGLRVVARVVRGCGCLREKVIERRRRAGVDARDPAQLLYRRNAHRLVDSARILGNESVQGRHLD